MAEHDHHHYEHGTELSETELCVGALVTVLAVPFVPPGVPILVAALVAALWGWFSRGPAKEGLEPDVDPAEYDANRVARSSDARQEQI